MTVVAIVGLIVAMSIPNFLRVRIDTEQVTAQKALKTVSAALESYRFVQVPPTYPSDLSLLANANPPYLTQQLVLSADANVPGSGIGTTFYLKSRGYRIGYMPNTALGNRIIDYILYAIPYEHSQNNNRAKTYRLDAGGYLIETNADQVPIKFLN